MVFTHAQSTEKFIAASKISDHQNVPEKLGHESKMLQIMRTGVYRMVNKDAEMGWMTQIV